MRKHINTPTDGWFLNCVALVRNGPTTWVPANTAREFDVFVLGYMKAMEDLGLPEYGKLEANLREEFQTWICAKFGKPPRVGWVRCIEELDSSPSNLVTFVREFEEFLVSRQRVLPEPDLDRWAGTSRKSATGDPDRG